MEIVLSTDNSSFPHPVLFKDMDTHESGFIDTISIFVEALCVQRREIRQYGYGEHLELEKALGF